MYILSSIKSRTVLYQYQISRGRAAAGNSPGTTGDFTKCSQPPYIVQLDAVGRARKASSPPGCGPGTSDDRMSDHVGDSTVAQSQTARGTAARLPGPAPAPSTVARPPGRRATV
eukprot:760371-Hanusia_phi.AAC.1